MTEHDTTLKRLVAVALAVLVVASLGAGPVASLTESNALTVQDPENAQVRVAHMSPDAPSVDVLVDNETVVQDLDFSDVTEYLDLQAGEHRVAIVTAENQTTVFQGRVTVEANERYTLMALGEVSENATEEFRVVALQDARRAPSGNDSAVRLVHASPDAGPVDVTVNQTGEVLFDNVTFANVTDYVTVPSGVYTLNVREATEDNDGEIVATFNESFLEETAYSAFAAGYVTPEDAPADESLDLFVAVDQTDNPELATPTAADNETTEEQTTEEAEADGETTTEEA